MRVRPRIKALVAILGVSTLLAGCSAFDSIFNANQGSTWSSDESEVQPSDIPTALIVDGSGSMNANDAPGSRIDAAKSAAGTYIDALPDGTQFSLWSYGLNTSSADADRPRGCQDTSNLIPTGEVNRNQAKDTINGIKASGWSPIASTILQAGKTLPTDVESSLVIVSDGEDECDGPSICEAAKTLRQTHPLLRIDAIGFRIDSDELNCAATTTGGLYVTADNTDQLTKRLMASRDTKLSKNTLTGRSFQGIEIGATHDDISAAYKDFPSLADGEVTECTSGDCGSTTVTIVHWRDCDWHFTEDGKLQLIDPGEKATTIDGFKVGDDANELAKYYGDPVDEAAGTLGGKDVTVRWYESDAERGLAWRVIIDAKNKIKAIVLCRCLPGSTPSTSDGSGSSGRVAGSPGSGSGSAGGGSGGNSQAGASFDHTEVVIYDVFEDDGSVRKPFQGLIVPNQGNYEITCTTGTEPGGVLHDCSMYQTQGNVGKCSIHDSSLFCPRFDSSGQLSIEKFQVKPVLQESRKAQGEAIPMGAVDEDGVVYVRASKVGTDYLYLDADSRSYSLTDPTGLRWTSNDYPFDRSQKVWTAEFARGYNAENDHKTIKIKRVYFIR